MSIYIWSISNSIAVITQPFNAHAQSLPTLSGNPKSTPNGGKTKRWNACLAARSSLYLAIVAMSESSRWISFRLSSIREGVTDLARTAEPRATRNQNR